jgi:MFS family permease
MREYIALLQRNANYRRLWLARVVSNLGDWFNLLASAALISNLTGAGTAVSYLFLARLLPVFVMSPVAGVFADRYERRAIMILADVLRAVTVLCFLLVRRPEEIWLLYVLTVVQFVLSSLYTPAHSALLSNVVTREDLVTANALDSFTWSTMLAIGALLGGIAAAVFGVTMAFVLDAATFLVSAWFVSRITVSGRADALAVRLGGWLEFAHGLGYLRGRRLILGIALVKTGGALVWGVVNVMEIPLAQQSFPINGSGTLTLGLLYAITGLGTGIGPLVVRRWVGDAERGMLWGIAAGFIAMTLGVVAMAAASSLGWVLAGSLVRAVGSGSLWVFSSVLLQRMVEDRFRGRVFAFEFAVMTLGQSFSTLWAGLALDQLALGVQGVILSAGLLSALLLVVWGWLHRRTALAVAAAALH